MDLQAEVVQALQLHLCSTPVRVMVEDITVNIVEDVAEGIVGNMADDMAVKTAPVTDDTTAEHVDVGQSLPPVGGTWEEDEEPDSLLFTYAAKQGSNLPFTADTSAVDLFYSYFTEDVWTLLVTETNWYAQQNPSEKPNPRVWTEVIVKEMKAFIGLLTIVGVVKLLRLTMYWQQSYRFISVGGISDVILADFPVSTSC